MPKFAFDLSIRIAQGLFTVKDVIGNEISNNDYLVYSVNRSGLAFYKVTLAREKNVQVQRLYLDKNETDGYRSGGKISLTVRESLMIIPKELLPIYENTPT
jgi:hypothetical protein